MEFWKDFWPNFASSIAAGVLFTFIITYLIRRINRPKLRIALNIGTGVNNKHELIFYCINEGSQGLMPSEIQWHVYFDLALMPNSNFKYPNTLITFDKKPFHYFSGINTEPCLPGSSIRLIAIPVKKNEKIAKDIEEFNWIDQASYFYSLSTSKGIQTEKRFRWPFEKKKLIDDGSFVQRRIYKIRDKVL